MAPAVSGGNEDFFPLLICPPKSPTIPLRLQYLTWDGILSVEVGGTKVKTNNAQIIYWGQI